MSERNIVCPVCGDQITTNLPRVRCRTCTVLVCIGDPVKASWVGADMAIAGPWLRNLPSSKHERPTTRRDGCGTEGGYERHRRRGERACTSCLAAHARRKRIQARLRRAAKRKAAA